MPRTAAYTLGAAGALLVLATAALAQTPDTMAAEHEALELGGYASTRFAAAPAPGRTGLALRRLVGEVEANRGRFHGETELELESKAESGAFAAGEEERELELEQAWLSYAASPSVALRAGIVVPPVGRFNARNEDYLWDYPRRPLIDRGVPVLPADAAWRAWGVGTVAQRALAGGRRLYLEAYALSPTEQAFAVVRPAAPGVPAQASVRASDDLVAAGILPSAVSGRLALRSAGGAELAVSGYAGRYAPESGGGRAPSWTLGVDGGGRVRSFVVEGEALYARYDGVDAVLHQFARSGGSALAPAPGSGLVDVAVDGLARTRYGLWLDVERPIALPPLVGAQPALLVPVARYEQVRLGDVVEGFAFAPGDGAAITRVDRSTRAEDRLSLGLAFRPLPKLVLHATAERSRALGGTLLSPAVTARSLTALCLGLAVGF